MSTPIYWHSFTHAQLGHDPIHVGITENGLCRITWPHESFHTFSTLIRKQIKDAILYEDEERVAPYINEIRAYLDGSLRTFTKPYDLRGTPFQVSVWQALATIPYGETRSYGDIAKIIGNPKAVRAVGGANGANPVPIVVPCHRVIGKNNSLTGFGGGLQMKETLLSIEGITAYIK